MNEHHIQLRSLTISDSNRTYCYHVIDYSGDTRQFTVDVALELFRTSPLKFQDGPLISRERLVVELQQETPDLLANGELTVSEPDIVGYLARHYPPKARAWNPYKRS
jgi:hypothetical protein